LRIAIVGPTFPYKGGGAHHTTELAHQLTAAGHTVVLESWRAQYPAFLYPGQLTISEPEGEPFPQTRWELSWRRPDGWFRTGRRLRSYDLVVLTVLTSVQVPAYLCILAGLRSFKGRGPQVVALCHNVLPHERKAYDAPFMRALLRRVDRVLVHSGEQAAVARSLRPRGAADEGLSVAELPPHLPAKRGAADRLAEPYGRLLFFGVVRPYKGLDVLLRALAAGPPDVSLTVAGEFWTDLDATRRLIDSLGLADRVELRPGYVPAAEIPGLFAKVDAMVLPYRAATASQNVWMAHEHGVPVIATKSGALADHVRDGVDGLLCEPDDVASLSDALKRFYADGEPARLKDGVRPVDPEPFWADYIRTLLPDGHGAHPGAAGAGGASTR
jgi:glycosyltransferase involved in cell wall biosynthesis